MPNTETKNKEIIYKLVKKHFDLEKNSLELFKFRLFFEPSIGKEYQDLLGDSKDQRHYYEMNDKTFEGLDEGWAYFKDNFKLFVSENKITYSHFKKNNFPVDGQIYKCGKALAKFYLNSNFPNRFIFDFYNVMDQDVAKIVFYKHPLIEKKLAYIRSVAISETDSNKLHISYRTGISSKSISLTINTKEIKERFENITDEFNAYISSILEQVGTKKMPNKKLYLVLSCNFADWFLCSTAEDWNSCLALNSDCSYCYWAGLPGLIGDKNRAMIYITDGVKKNYNGIEVDRIIARSWLLTMRRGKSKESLTEITFVKTYPSGINLKDIASKLLNVDLIYAQAQEEESYRSRYYFEMFYHNYSKGKKVATGIFEDTTSVHIAKKNKAEKIPHKYGYYTVGRGKDAIFIKNGKSHLEEEGDVFYISSSLDEDDESENELCGLDFLIKKEKDLSSFREEE